MTDPINPGASLPGFPSFAQEPFFRTPGEYVPFNPLGQLDYLQRFGLIGDIARNIIWWMLPSTGYTSFFGETNLLSALQRQSFDWAHMMYLQRMYDYDLPRMEEILRGIAALSGQNWEAMSPNVRAALGLLRNLPLPQQIALHKFLTGGRSELALAARLHQVGRFLRDPVTGLKGLSALTSMTMARSWGEFFFEGTPYLDRTFGFESQDLADIYFELARRGMGVRARPFVESVTEAFNRLGRRPEGAALQREIIDDLVRRVRNEFLERNRLAGLPEGRLTTDQQEYIRRLEQGQPLPIDLALAQRMAQSPIIQTAMRSDLADRARQSVSRYAELLGVMREIFDEANQPNTPVSKLMEHLEYLAGGNLAGVDPARLRTLLVRIKHTMSNANMSIEAVAAIHQETAKLIAELNLPREAAMGITAGTLGFVSAAAEVGMPSGEILGAFSLNEQAAMFTRRQAAAMRSSMANRLGLIVRMAQSLGDRAPPALQQLAEEIRTGQLSEQTQNMLLMSEGRFINFLGTTTGLDTATIRKMTQQNEVNRLYAATISSMPTITAMMQQRELLNQLEPTIRSQLTGHLEERKIGAATGEIIGILEKSSDMSDVELRGALAGILDKYGVKDPLRAESLFGAILQLLRSRGIGPNIQQAVVSPRVRAAMELANMEADLERAVIQMLPAELRTNFGGAIRRMQQALAQAGVEPEQAKNLQSMLLQSLGLTSTQEAKSRLEAVTRGLVDSQRKLVEKLQTMKDISDDDPAKRQLVLQVYATGRVLSQVRAMQEILEDKPISERVREAFDTSVHVETPPEFQRLKRDLMGSLIRQLSIPAAGMSVPAPVVTEFAYRMSERLHTIDVSEVEKNLPGALQGLARKTIDELSQRESITEAEARSLRKIIDSPEFGNLLKKMSTEEAKIILRDKRPQVLQRVYVPMEEVDGRLQPTGAPVTPQKMQEILERQKVAAPPAVPTAQVLSPEKLTESLVAAVQSAAPKSIEMNHVVINIEGAEFVKGRAATVVSGPSRYRTPVGGV